MFSSIIVSWLLLVLAVDVTVSVGTQYPCCLPNKLEGLLVKISSVHGVIGTSLAHISFAQDFDKGLTALRIKETGAHILIEDSGNTYKSVKGACVVKFKTGPNVMKRCSLCQHGSHVAGNYFGAGDRTLSFNAYKVQKFMKQDLNTTFVVNTYDGVNVVPINKQDNYLRNGVTYRSQNSYMGLKDEITSPEVTFAIPEGCGADLESEFSDLSESESESIPKWFF